jgi:cysteine-S-conjugate beta-lyase
MRRDKKSTTLIHHAYTPPRDFLAPQPGIHKASTVIFPTVTAMRSREWKDKTAYTYGLHGTPTTYILEERLCTLEGGQQCLLVPSGLAAISLVDLSLLTHGDEVLIPDNAYSPNKALAEVELKAWGITHQIYDPMNPEDLAHRISSRTRLVWIEAAGSMTLEFPDVCELVRICRQANNGRGVVSALDNTWGAGLAFNPFKLEADTDLAVDISIHALTKYPSGGGDVLMGSVITQDFALHSRLKLTHMRLGLGIGANDAELLLRSLPSVTLRYTAHDQAARILANWCLNRPEFAQVLHPALPHSPGHAHWSALCGTELGRSAGLFSVVFDQRYSQLQVDAFCNTLRLFKLGYSWGGPISLVLPCDLASARQTWPAYLAIGNLVRFSVGLEQVEDLQSDLTQALTLCFEPP